MSVPVQNLVRCSLSVECGGRPIKCKGKDIGIEISKPGGAVMLRVIGTVRDVRLAAKDIQDISDKYTAEGRLGVVARDGTKVLISRAQPEQLEHLVQLLRGRKAEVALSRAHGARGSPADAQWPRPAKKVCHSDPRTSSRLPTPTPQQVPSTSPCMKQKDSVTANAPCLLQQAIFPQQLLEELIAFLGGPGAQLSPFQVTCKVLSAALASCRTVLHFHRAHGVGVPPQLLVRCVLRHSSLSVLDFSGYAELSGLAVKELETAGVHILKILRILNLRGCKLLSDTSVHRLLKNCSQLEALDVLDMPKLTNEAIPCMCLTSLSIFHAGMLMSLSVNRTRAETNRTINQPSGKYTAMLLESLVKSRSSTQLTHVSLVGCDDVQRLPPMPVGLRHLDLRGASITMANEASSKSLAACTQLTTLILAGNLELSEGALRKCIGSLPKPDLLVALDLSGCLGVGRLLLEDLAPSLNDHKAKSRFPNLTHLRLAECGNLTDANCVWLLKKLNHLQVFDMSACLGIAHPLLDYYDDRARVASQNEVEYVPDLKALRLLGIAGTRLNDTVESTKRELQRIAPSAVAVRSFLPICDYRVIPSRLT